MWRLRFSGTDVMSNLKNTPPRHEVYVLLAARGNPDHGQDPDQPPFGVPDDQLVDCSQLLRPSMVYAEASIAEASKRVRAFIEEHGLGGGNWVGGDVWANGKHLGHVAYNGRFFSDEQGPLVRHGEFVFANPSAKPSQPSPANKVDGRIDRLLSSVDSSTDEDWYHVFALRPDLADRMRAALNRLAPEDAATSSSGPSMLGHGQQGLVAALEAIEHQLTVGEASEGDRRDIAWCARTASAALEVFRAHSSVGNEHDQGVHETSAPDLREALPDDDRYTVGFRDAVESLTLALQGHVASDVLRESIQTALDAYANHVPECEDDQFTPTL